jgi:hypothetical protein
MKVQVSHRLDEGLLAWATEYGESRKASRSSVIEEALRHFQELAKSGVPDLPEEQPQKVSPVKSQVDAPVPSLLAGRQAALNAAKYRSKR